MNHQAFRDLRAIAGDNIHFKRQIEKWIESWFESHASTQIISGELLRHIRVDLEEIKEDSKNTVRRQIAAHLPLYWMEEKEDERIGGNLRIRGQLYVLRDEKKP